MVGIGEKRWSPARWGSLAGFAVGLRGRLSSGWKRHSAHVSHCRPRWIPWEHEWREKGVEGGDVSRIRQMGRSLAELSWVACRCGKMSFWTD